MRRASMQSLTNQLARIEARISPPSPQPAMLIPTYHIPDGDSEQNRQAERYARLAHVAVKYLGVAPGENGCEP